jgi:hypothetical protein
MPVHHSTPATRGPSAVTVATKIVSSARDIISSAHNIVSVGRSLVIAGLDPAILLPQLPSVGLTP